MLEWIGDEFDPRRFDCAEINRRIATLLDPDA